MKNLTVAVVLDDEEGMLFYGKRQSRDVVLIDEFLETVKGKEVFAANFSWRLFSGKEGVTMCDEPLTEATIGAACFIENFPIKPHINEVKTLIIYRWNRLYPSDFKFDLCPAEHGYKLKSTSEFVGGSHEKITKEIYEREI